MHSPAALPLFGDAYLADTQHLSLEEHGAYLKLLIIAWRSPNCALPEDDRRIATMLGVTPKKWASLKPAVMAFWHRTEHGWEQKRLSKERRYVAKKSEQNADAANKRWKRNQLENNKRADADADANAYANGDAPPPPPIRTSTNVRDNPKPKSITRRRPGAGGYVFEGQVIKLTDGDMGRWRKAYPALDLPAVLQSRDDWLATMATDDDRRRWFVSTSSYLAREQAKASAVSRSPAAVPSLRDTAPAL